VTRHRINAGNTTENLVNTRFINKCFEFIAQRGPFGKSQQIPKLSKKTLWKLTIVLIHLTIIIFNVTFMELD
jgi:hypothetical protein